MSLVEYRRVRLHGQRRPFWLRVTRETDRLLVGVEVRYDGAAMKEVCVMTAKPWKTPAPRPAGVPYVRFARQHPVNGRPNPYRMRWFQHEGVTFVAEARDLYGLWTVSFDSDLLDYSRPGPGRNECAVIAWIKSPDYWCEVGLRLEQVRTTIAGLITSPDWPRIRDAYLALLPQHQ